MARVTRVAPPVQCPTSRVSIRASPAAQTERDTVSPLTQVFQDFEISHPLRYLAEDGSLVFLALTHRPHVLQKLPALVYLAHDFLSHGVLLASLRPWRRHGCGGRLEPYAASTAIGRCRLFTQNVSVLELLLKLLLVETAPHLGPTASVLRALQCAAIPCDNLFLCPQPCARNLTGQIRVDGNAFKQVFVWSFWLRPALCCWLSTSPERNRGRWPSIDRSSQAALLRQRQARLRHHRVEHRLSVS